MKVKKYLIPFSIIFLILAADQILKIWIKTHLHLGQEIHVFKNLFILHFTENNGIAFGFEIAGGAGKLLLTFFRIIASAFIGFYLIRIIKKEMPLGFIISISLIFVGAVGNIVDSIFYGVFFKYNSLFFGKVVDMLYFPVITTHYPHWFPFFGGNELIFFRPVFNISDSAITLGVFSVILFYRNILKKL